MVDYTREKAMLEMVEKLDVSEAMKIVEGDIIEEAAGFAAGCSRLLFNGGYEYLGVIHPNPLSHRLWMLLYGKGKLPAKLSIELKASPKSTVEFGENPLNLRILNGEEINKVSRFKERPHPLRILLEGGYAIGLADMYDEDVYFTTPRILSFRPFGLHEYKIDEKVRKEIEDMLA